LFYNDNDYVPRRRSSTIGLVTLRAISERDLLPLGIPHEHRAEHHRKTEPGCAAYVEGIEMRTDGKSSLAVLAGDGIGLGVKNAGTSGTATPDLGGTASADAFAAAVITALEAA
jgi:hypothetical protein